jgi:hypothetical protein
MSDDNHASLGESVVKRRYNFALLCSFHAHSVSSKKKGVPPFSSPHLPRGMQRKRQTMPLRLFQATLHLPALLANA